MTLLSLLLVYFFLVPGIDTYMCHISHTSSLDTQVPLPFFSGTFKNSPCTQEGPLPGLSISAQLWLISPCDAAPLQSRPSFMLRFINTNNYLTGVLRVDFIIESSRVLLRVMWRLQDSNARMGTGWAATGPSPAEGCSLSWPGFL